MATPTDLLLATLERGGIRGLDDLVGDEETMPECPNRLCPHLCD